MPAAQWPGLTLWPALHLFWQDRGPDQSKRWRGGVRRRPGVASRLSLLQLCNQRRNRDLDHAASILCDEPVAETADRPRLAGCPHFERVGGRLQRRIVGVNK